MKLSTDGKSARHADSAMSIRLDERSKVLRRTILASVKAAGRGHVGSSFSLVEILRVLYDDILKYRADEPRWEERDRFILSKGHGCLTLYAMLADKGFFPKDELLKFCTSSGMLGGHPEYGKVPGVEASTGSLGHGFSIGIGFAIHARHVGKNSRVFVVLGDGESNEGSNWEAALSASKHKLDNLTVIVDYNKYQSYSSTAEVLDLEPFADKWKSFGFAVSEVNGHDIHALRTVFKEVPLQKGQPTAIICHTIKGKGTKLTENNLAWHHKNKLNDAEMTQLHSELEMA